jgi:hypothetical protein
VIAQIACERRTQRGAKARSGPDDSLAQIEMSGFPCPDRLKTRKGYGPAFQAKILQGTEMSRRPQGRHIHRAAAAISRSVAFNSDERAFPIKIRFVATRPSGFFDERLQA